MPALEDPNRRTGRVRNAPRPLVQGAFSRFVVRPSAEAAPLRPGPRQRRPGEDEHAAGARTGGQGPSARCRSRPSEARVGLRGPTASPARGHLGNAPPPAAGSCSQALRWHERRPRGQRRACRTPPSFARSSSTRTTRCSSSTSRRGSPCRVARASRAMSTPCSRRCATGRARSRAWSTGSTATRRGFSSSRGRGSRRRSSPRRSGRARPRKIYWALVKGVPKPHQGRDLDLSCQGRGAGGRANAGRPPWRRRGEPRRLALFGGRPGRAEARLADHATGDRSHSPASRPRRPYRPPDHRRSEIFRGGGQLGLSRRHAEAASPACAADRDPASIRRPPRRDGAAAAAYAAELEPSRLRSRDGK